MFQYLFIRLSLREIAKLIGISIVVSFVATYAQGQNAPIISLIMAIPTFICILSLIICIDFFKSWE